MSPQIPFSIPVSRLGQPIDLRALLVASAISLALLAGCATPTAPGPARLPSESAAAIEGDASAAAVAEREDADGPLDRGDASSVPEPDEPERRVLIVKASAYNSRRGQTDATPSIAAWGDRLKPGMKVIAVSSDLLELGLVRGQRVQIAGLEGEFVVLDRMPSRWRQKIDIYMGTDVRAALDWGVRQVEISWVPQVETAIGIESGGSASADSE